MGERQDRGVLTVVVAGLEGGGGRRDRGVLAVVGAWVSVRTGVS